MISMRIASAIAVTAFIIGAFSASSELRAFAANTVSSADIVNNSIRSIDIKDGEVKAADIGANAVTDSDIAANAVGASELKGVSKLIFATCSVDFASTLVGNFASDDCALSGLELGDHVIATQRTIDSHMSFQGAFLGLDDSDNVVIRIYAKNTGTTPKDAGSMTYAVMVYR